MPKFILGSKLNMSQVFDATGKVVPVTVIKVGGRVAQVKTKEKDGYQAVQIGFGKKKRVNKAIAGHTKSVGNVRKLKEFRTDEALELGAALTASQFEVGDYVDVQGIMKGRGFTGPVKRYGFKGAPASHGHDHPRAVGSIGQRFPQHTLKGRRMAGRMGGQNVTVKNLEVIQVDAARNMIAVKGAVPGANGGLLKITPSIKASKAGK